jgi:hypothetical protein
MINPLDMGWDPDAMAVSRPVPYTGCLSRGVAGLLAKTHLGPCAEIVPVSVRGSAVQKQWQLRSPTAPTVDGRRWWIHGEGGTPAFAFINARVCIMSNDDLLLEWLRFLKVRRESGENVPERQFLESYSRACPVVA